MTVLKNFRKGKETETHNLLKLFECPICYNRIMPPVQVCTNGHAVCKSCLTTIQKCPLCNSELSPNKNTMLDNIMQECVLPCKYSESGCSVRLKLSELTQHETKLCKHRKIQCPILNCDALLLGKDFPEHICSKHAPISIQGKTTRSLNSADTDMNFLCERKSNLLILEETHRDKDIFRLAYHYVGDAEEADNWVFEVKFGTLGGLTKTVFKSHLSPFGWDMNDIKREGRCLEVSRNFLENFIVDGSLKFSIKIESIPIRLKITKALRKTNIFVAKKKVSESVIQI